jgi:hypothetical protein
MIVTGPVDMICANMGFQEPVISEQKKVKKILLKFSSLQASCVADSSIFKTAGVVYFYYLVLIRRQAFKI